MSEVARIYDLLFSFESKKRTDYYPIHKKLNFDGKYQDLIDWIIDRVEILPSSYLLDAGCGTGYTLFKLNREKQVKGIGITISSNEAAFANNLSEQKGLVDQLNFQLASFDQKIGDVPFDHIFMVESLKHSPDTKQTLKNIQSQIKEGGTLIIADDFAESNSSEFQRHKELWEAEGFMNLNQIEEAFPVDQWELQNFNLTDEVPVRPLWKLNLIQVFATFLGWFSIGNFKRNIQTYIGGILLEKLYSKRLVSYRVLIAKSK